MYSIEIDLHEALREVSNVAHWRGIERASTLEEWAVRSPNSQEWYHSNLNAEIAIVLVGGWSAGKSKRRDLSGLGRIKGNSIISKPD